jgi:hypothetical protein
MRVVVSQEEFDDRRYSAVATFCRRGTRPAVKGFDLPFLRVVHYLYCPSIREEMFQMATIEQELDSFTEFAKERISNGGSDLSLDELFDLWRSENPSDKLYAENVAAVIAAIQDFKNGDRGTPAGEHSDQLRREFGIDKE